MNRVTLVGTVGQAPRGGSFNGTIYSNVKLTTQESFTNRRGCATTRTLWHRIVAFDGIANFINNTLQLGDVVQVDGRLNYRDYTDQYGADVTITEIVVLKIKLIERIKKEPYRQDNTGASFNHNHVLH
jgi:single-strand DNA-binding protein